MNRRLSKAIRRARDLGIEAHVADMVEAYVRAAEDYQSNREPVDETRIVQIHQLPAAVWELGELHRVEYDRDEDGQAVRRYHDFKGERPLLVVGVDDNRLWIVDGTYSVTDRGIVG